MLYWMKYKKLFNNCNSANEVLKVKGIRIVMILTPVPEPTTIALLGIGLVGLAGAEVRRR